MNHRPRLSAAMIVRDEERFLGDCLASMRGVADEVVVVDTGSRDRTREIALQHGARLASFPWTGDFAAARNEALDLATGDWILYIDADERVRDGDRVALDPLLADPEILGLTVRFRPITGFTRYRELRLFRNHPRLRFRGVIHESHLPALDELVRAEGGRVEDSALGIDHIGYDGDQSHKHGRNLPLLEARLATEPGHTYSWAHLGSTLLALGRRDEAVAAWERGIEVVRARQVATTIDCLNYLCLLNTRFANGEPLGELLDEAYSRFPFVPEVVWFKARAEIAAERPADAIPLLESLVTIDADVHIELVMGHDARLFRVWAHDALALCLLRLERYDEAAHHYARAEAAEPTLERTVKRKWAEARAASKTEPMLVPRAGAPSAGEPRGGSPRRRR